MAQLVTSTSADAVKAAGRITMFANHKGGPGKTTVLLLFAAELARRGYRVLLVDLDPQGNLSRRVGYTEADLDELPTIAEAIHKATPEALGACLLPCMWEQDYAERIDLAPSKIELEGRISEAAVPGAWLRLQDCLVGKISGAYDFVLIDTAPTLGHLFALAAVCADDGIIPVMPEYDAVRGGQRIMNFLANERNRASLGIHAEIAGVVVNARTTTSRHRDMTDQALAAWGDKLWTPWIPERTEIGATQDRADSPLNTFGEAGPLVREIASKLVDRYLGVAA